MTFMPFFQPISTFLDNLSVRQMLSGLAAALLVWLVLIYIEARLKKAAAAREQLRIRQGAKEVRGTIARFGSSVENEYITRYTFQLLGEPGVYTTLSGGYETSGSAVLMKIGDRVSFYATPEAEHVFELKFA